MFKLFLPLLALVLLCADADACHRARGQRRHLRPLFHRRATVAVVVPTAYVVQGYKAMPKGPACPECEAAKAKK